MLSSEGPRSAEGGAQGPNAGKDAIARGDVFALPYRLHE